MTTKCARRGCRRRSAVPAKAGWHLFELDWPPGEWQKVKSGWRCQECTGYFTERLNDQVFPPPGPLKMDGAPYVVPDHVAHRHTCAYDGCGARKVFNGFVPNKDWGEWSHFGGDISEWPMGFYCPEHNEILS